MDGITKTFRLSDGREITLETGKLAKQADGSVVVKLGDTMLLATVVAVQEAKENVDFMPLSVEYREKYAAAGRFPGGFFKRETRPSDYEVLISRLVDRALRPLFPDDFHAEVQVIVTLISADKNFLPDSLACLAASAALSVSDIPFHGPISEVRVGRINGQFVINPGIAAMAESDIDLMVAASFDNIVMVEGEMKEVSEDDMVEAIRVAHEAIKEQCKAQLELASMVEKSKVKRTYSHETNDPEFKERLKAATYTQIYEMAKQGIPSKQDRKTILEATKEAFVTTLTDVEKETYAPMISRYYHEVEKEAIRNATLDTHQRVDGRKLDEIRPIWSEIDYLPAAHGSAIFTRGETQSLTTVTLGTKLDAQVIDGAVIEEKVNFILHYNFPSFATGEVKPIRSTGRREIGHGNLALRALKNMIPQGPDNLYTIRVVSDILESNGSSSMATVCAGTMALMDAGVKLIKPVSGIAMGLITDSKRYVVLSDILGDEDHLGDMDFKVCGTRDGITACQMDIKVDGLSFEILKEALQQARRGRMHILDEIAKTISEPRADYKPFVPRITQMKVPKEFIGAIIGPGGKVIQEMQRETGTTIVIEEVGEFGIIDIVADNLEARDKVIEKIKRIASVPEVGEIYRGKVKNIQTFGAFVEILPNQDGLLHISEIDWKRLDKVEDALKVGDEVEVKLIEVDAKTGKLKLSRRALLPKPEGYVERAPEHRSENRPDRSHDHNNDRDRDRSRDRGGDHRGPRR
ncbi:MAG: polyribonucleotide nucleotidyltransferase [Bacteroidales bacterium]|nr:polyribonucleotide nucleotidyltransferase [Bacteroidales bacterium]MDD4603827.1 polyribonucleotide nucleotidyltransferase [Bacteroidales bacterium]